MRCNNCGSEISPDVKFCTNCGAPVAGGPAAQTEQSAQPGSSAQYQSAQPDPSTPYQSDPGAPTAVVRQKSNKKSPLVIALIIVGVVAVMAAAGFGIGRLIAGSDSDTTVSESKDSGSDSSKSADSDSDSEESENDVMKDFPGVDKDNKVNYRIMLNKSTYKTYNDGDFSFLYPKGFFNNVTKDEYSGKTTYTFTGSDGVSELVYEKYDETGDPKDTIIALSEGKASELTGDLYYPYEDVGGKFYGYYPADPKSGDSIHGIVSGFQTGSGNLQEYNYFVSDKGKVYTMKFVYPESEMKNDSPEAGYMAECYYRGFSKSNSKGHKIRSYKRSNY